MIILSVYTSKLKDVRKSVDIYAGQVARHMEEENVRYKLDSMVTDTLTDSLLKYSAPFVKRPLCDTVL